MIFIFKRPSLALQACEPGSSRLGREVTELQSSAVVLKAERELLQRAGIRNLHCHLLFPAP